MTMLRMGDYSELVLASPHCGDGQPDGQLTYVSPQTGGIAMNFGPAEIVVFLLIAAGVIAVFYVVRWLLQFLN